MNVQIEESWKAHLAPEFDKDYFRTLTDFVKSEYSQYQIFPPGKLIFNAFNLCPFDKVKVVIIGQDPYHGPGQAHGLCFSVNDGVPFPPSLVNIFKEIKVGIMLMLYTIRTGNTHHGSRKFSVFTILIGKLCSIKRDTDLFIMLPVIAPVKL